MAKIGKKIAIMKLLDMARSGLIEKGEKVLMIHTGGIPGIYTKHHRVEFEKELMPYIHIVK